MTIWDYTLTMDRENSMNKKRQIALITTAIYTAIMALGMWYMKNIAGSTYESPEMPKHLLLFEVVMTAIAIGVYYKLFRGDLKKFKTKKTNKLFISIFGLMSLNLAAMGYMFLTNGNLSRADMSILLAILLATFLVGLSEELLFRGIVLPAYLDNKGSRIKAVLIASFLFSIFHLSNLFGGLEVSGMTAQLFNAMLMGLTFAGLALEIGFLTPIIIFHFLYDFLLISNNYTEVDASPFLEIGGVMGWALGVVMFGFIVYKEIQAKKAAASVAAGERKQ